LGVEIIALDHDEHVKEENKESHGYFKMFSKFEKEDYKKDSKAQKNEGGGHDKVIITEECSNQLDYWSHKE